MTQSGPRSGCQFALHKTPYADLITPLAHSRIGADGQVLRDRECLVEIGNDVVDVLDADRKPNVALGNACARLLFNCELGMCGAGRVNGERASVADIGDVIEHLEAVNEFAAGIAAAPELEAD
jgi:hypothetical protein